MKFLMDTHILIWHFEKNEKLAEKVRKIISDKNNTTYFSSLSIFEIELKHKNRPDKMPYSGEELISYCKTFGFNLLAREFPRLYRRWDESRIDNRHFFAKIKLLENKE